LEYLHTIIPTVPLFQSPYLGVGNSPHSHAAHGQVGILLCNLGTPDAPTTAAVRRYLAEFLSDPRLIELPRWLWLPILYGVILNVRPRRSAHAYSKIWTPAGSPLLALSQAQQSAIEARLSAAYPGRVRVALAMRYGNPSIMSALERLRAANVQRLLVLPLYPQYSGPATGSVFDGVSAVLQRWRWVPDVRFIASYHDEPAYIAALAASITEHWQAVGRSERLYFSFHGLPHKYFMRGDPYFCQCQATARLVAQTLGLQDTEWRVVFQSRFGRERWLEPYADRTLQEAARAGTRVVDVVCPGFAVDCLETLEEIALQNRALFMAAGGQDLRYIAALNARDDHITALCGIIQRNLAGWPECAPEWRAAHAAESGAARVARAQLLGASA
jgi:ferrochelatase